MKNILFLSTILFFISSCNESNLSEVPSAHQIPKAGKALQSSFISGLQSWEARRVSEIASNGQEILLSYSDNNTTKAIPLNNSNNETPVTLSSFNFRTSRLLERHTSLRTRSGASDSSVIQLPDSLNTLRAIRAGNYIIATGLYTQGRYLLYDLDTKTFDFHLSYPEHPVYPALREDTKAILYASTVLKVRPDNRYFVCGDMYSGNLEFCRITGDHIDRIKAYCYHHPRVYITEKTVPDVAYSRDNRFGFTDITVTSEKVYAIYSGHTYRENPRTFQQCRQLLVFDWEGTLLETYALDTPLTHITVDVSENVLYAIGHEPQTCLMKLVLDN